MFLDTTDDQAALLATVSTILARTSGKSALDGAKASFDAGLDSELEANGVLELPGPLPLVRPLEKIHCALDPFLVGHVLPASAVPRVLHPSGAG